MKWIFALVAVAVLFPLLIAFMVATGIVAGTALAEGMMRMLETALSIRRAIRARSEGRRGPTE